MVYKPKIFQQTKEEDDTDYFYDMVKGGHGKKSVLSVLNKKNISRYELDEVMNDWE